MSPQSVFRLLACLFFAAGMALIALVLRVMDWQFALGALAGFALYLGTFGTNDAR